MPDPLDLAAVEATIRLALDEVSAATKRQWDGRGAFRLTIPVDEAHDSDCIITNALLMIDRLLALVHAQRAALAWYGEQANAMQRYMEAKPPKADAMMAVAQALALDAGTRARAALAMTTDAEAGGG